MLKVGKKGEKEKERASRERARAKEHGKGEEGEYWEEEDDNEE